MEYVSIFIGIYLIFAMSDIKKLVQKNRQNTENEDSEVLKALLGKTVQFRFDPISEYELEEIVTGKITKLDGSWLSIEKTDKDQTQEMTIRISDITSKITLLEQEAIKSN